MSPGYKYYHWPCMVLSEGHPPSFFVCLFVLFLGFVCLFLFCGILVGHISLAWGHFVCDGELPVTEKSRDVLSNGDIPLAYLALGDSTEVQKAKPSR